MSSTFFLADNTITHTYILYKLVLNRRSRTLPSWSQVAVVAFKFKGVFLTRVWTSILKVSRECKGSLACLFSSSTSLSKKFKDYKGCSAINPLCIVLYYLHACYWIIFWVVKIVFKSSSSLAFAAKLDFRNIYLNKNPTNWVRMRKLWRLKVWRNRKFYQPIPKPIQLFDWLES